MSASETFLDGKLILHCGDCLDILPTLPAESVDSSVTDPPYHLTSIVKRFGSKDAAPAKSNGATGAYARASSGFMGKQWDGGDIAFRPEVWREVFRVLKPGGHLVAFGGTRTYHRMACAIEDAGFEIRDCIQWLYGSGFPKSLDVSKAIDKANGVKGSFGDPKSAAHAGWIDRGQMRGGDGHEGYQRPWMDDEAAVDRAARQYLPASPEAAQWSGFGTTLKPACEPIVLARKPLIGTVAENVLKHGTGALNIDGCRVGTDESTQRSNQGGTGNPEQWRTGNGGDFTSGSKNGRWPANIIHDGSEEVLAAFPDAPGQLFASTKAPRKAGNVYGTLTANRNVIAPRNNGGSAARFFYTSKADSDDRLGSKHPTVKPLDLMQYLVRLVTPLGGLVLDPFAGTGTTGEAAFREGMRAVLIEREAEYQDDIRRRMALVMAGPEERSRASTKERMKEKPVDWGPLFGGSETTREDWTNPNEAIKP